MDKQLLDILVCPVSGASLSMADAGTLAAVNAEIDQGRATYADDSHVDQRIQALLVTRDGLTGYRIDDGIPIMLPERGIALPAAP